MKSFLINFTVSFLIFTLFFGGGAWYLLNRQAQEKHNEVIQTPEHEELAVVQEPAGERQNILLLGVDALNVEELKEPARTDTMMVLSINPKDNSAFILSVPRDTLVNIRGKRNKDKINHAHAFGGVSLALKTVKDFLNIPIHAYVRVDYKALFETIDALGGVEVDVKQRMVRDDPKATPPLHIRIEPGLQTLNGENAMKYLRYRKDNKGGGYPDGDLGRIKVQQEFMETVFKKIKEPANLTKVPKLIDIFYKYVKTNLSNMEMLQLAQLALRVQPEDLRRETIPGVDRTINRVSYYVPDEEKTKALVQSLLQSEPKVATNPVPSAVTAQEPAGEPAATSSEPAEIPVAQPTEPAASEPPAEPALAQEEKAKVLLLNGGGKKGAAAKASGRIEKAGPAVVGAGNANNFNYKQTLIYYKDSSQTAAQKIQSALGKGKLIRDPERFQGKKYSVLVVLGKDY